MPPATPSLITFQTEPNSTTAGAILNPISVSVVDKFGNPVPNAAVNLTTSLNTLSGVTVATTNSAGQAVFTNLFVTKTGTYTLAASTAGLTTKAASSTFIITPAAGHAVDPHAARQHHRGQFAGHGHDPGHRSSTATPCRTRR